MFSHGAYEPYLSSQSAFTSRCPYFYPPNTWPLHSASSACLACRLHICAHGSRESAVYASSPQPSPNTKCILHCHSFKVFALAPQETFHFFSLYFYPTQIPHREHCRKYLITLQICPDLEHWGKEKSGHV